MILGVDTDGCKARRWSFRVEVLGFQGESTTIGAIIFASSAGEEVVLPPIPREISQISSKIEQSYNEIARTCLKLAV